MRYLFTFLIAFFVLAGLSACGSSAPVLKPFKMDIQQGNVVTSKMLLQLKPGMTKSQVRFIMGTPLIVDSFHKDRWDYFYQLRQAGKVVEQRRVILAFEKDLLKSVRGDVVPQGSPEAAASDTPTTKTIVMPDKKLEEKSWTEKLKFWKKDETPVVKPLEKAAEPPKELAPESAKPEPAALEAPAEVPSVLAVPIEVAPAIQAPAVAQEPAPVQEKAAPAEMIEPPKPEPVPVEAPKAPPPAPAPIKAVQPMNKDEKMIFRLDKTLKQELLQQEVAPKAEAPAVEVPAKPKKKAVDEPLPPETEPGFFDRMLEKIGF